MPLLGWGGLRKLLTRVFHAVVREDGVEMMVLSLV